MQPRFFIDSADPDAWLPMAESGWVHGITTNPLILRQDGRSTSIATARDLLADVEALQLGELQFQALGNSREELVSRGREIAGLAALMTVKIPAVAAGFAAAAQLRREGVRITLTACYTLAQCALARAMQLDYVAPYYGRMLESGIDADARLDGMQQIMTADSNARVLIASLRSEAQVAALLARGFDTFTLRPALAQALMDDTASTQAAADFNAAAS